MVAGSHCIRLQFYLFTQLVRSVNAGVIQPSKTMSPFVQMLVFIAGVAFGTTCFAVFWFYWMRMCVRMWIQRWADSESVTLESHKLHFFNRGPFPISVTAISLPMYFRVTCSDKLGKTKTGWVKLGSRFFLGGKGVVIWD